MPIPPRPSGDTNLPTQTRIWYAQRMNLLNKKVLLGITGGIAAYKAADLCRQLKKAGAEVRVVMTEGAKHFITPTTLQALSGEPVRDDLFDPAGEASMGHIELARWADQILIAPASADFLARLNAGMANDLLTTLCLATDSPIAVAPAMNQLMWKNQATQDNIASLRQRGLQIIGPAAGEQACGEVGPGRMEEPLDILDQLFSEAPQPLAGKHVLITAGPTQEDIDPVRYLSNRSSGKMGFAIAAAANAAGADVTLVAGPVKLATPQGVTRIDVKSALDMHEATTAKASDHDIFIATAAVADYRIDNPANQKIKKSQDSLQLSLVKNPDILADVSAMDACPFCVGFAAETNDLETYARGKLERKKLDMIAANPVNDGQAFDKDDNMLYVFWNGGETHLPSTSKTELAKQLINVIAQRYNEKDNHASN